VNNKDRYFIFNHEAAFAEGILAGLTWREGELVLVEGEERGVYVSPLLDSLERDNTWQRVLIRASRPLETRITCCLYSINLPYEAQAVAELLREPGGSLGDKLSRLNRFQAFIIENAEDFLLPDVSGRYLIAVLELYRQGDVSPAVQLLQIYAAEETFLHYLPEIYQEEGGFLDRYLRLFSAQYLEMEQAIGRLPASFDPQVAPTVLLPWLAEIMGIPHIELWETEGLRQLLISRVYARKGTLSGLTDLMEIYAGVAPYVVETFRMPTGIEEMDVLYSDCRLLILMPPVAANERRSAEALHMLLQSYLPPTVSYRLITLEYKARLSGYSYLDVNACLSGLSPAVLETEARIGYTVLEG